MSGMEAISDILFIILVQKVRHKLYLMLRLVLFNDSARIHLINIHRCLRKLKFVLFNDTTRAQKLINHRLLDIKHLGKKKNNNNN